MALPIRDVVLPAVLRGRANGQLPASILVTTPGQAGGPDVVLVRTAARCYRAMAAAALADGHTLKTTSLYDSYRPLEVQRRIFLARYQTTAIPGQPSKLWNGVRYWKKPGVATAAVPGTSNHGRALAGDFGEERDGDAGTESIDQATVNWLIEHADEYGFSAELQSEPWHWRCYIGDQIPAAVLAYERGEDNDMQLDDTVHFITGQGVTYAKPTTTVEGALASTHFYTLQVRNLVQGLRGEVVALRVVIEALAAVITKGGGTVDTAQIMGLIGEELAKLREGIRADADAEADARALAGINPPTG